MTPFVRRAAVSFGRGDFRRVDDPSWADIEEMLKEANERGGRIDLQSDGETEMTIFAEGNAFHMGISIEETDYYFASNGADPTIETGDIFGHSFSRDQILTNFQSVVEGAKTFWTAGTPSDSLVWLHETLEG